MTPYTENAGADPRDMAQGHPGASSGERAAYDLVKNFHEGKAVDFADCFGRLDGTGKRAVLQRLVDLVTGKAVLIGLR